MIYSHHGLYYWSMPFSCWKMFNAVDRFCLSLSWWGLLLLFTSWCSCTQILCAHIFSLLSALHLKVCNLMVMVMFYFLQTPNLLCNITVVQPQWCMLTGILPLHHQTCCYLPFLKTRSCQSGGYWVRLDQCWSSFALRLMMLNIFSSVPEALVCLLANTSIMISSYHT